MIMAETQTNLKVDFTGGMLFLGIFLLIIYFWGEPDLHDAIIYHLMGPQAMQVESGTPS
jgi:hypothetical protein